jgi:hypothetical protein
MPSDELNDDLICFACNKITPKTEWVEKLYPFAPPEGRKDDGGKNELDLLPPRAIEAIGEVLSYGARKYSPDNWRKVPDGQRRYLAACLRHLFAHMRGEKNDPESGLPHLAHAGCCILFLLELEQK